LWNHAQVKNYRIGPTIVNLLIYIIFIDQRPSVLNNQSISGSFMPATIVSTTVTSAKGRCASVHATKKEAISFWLSFEGLFQLFLL